MSERFTQGQQVERGPVRKTIDKLAFGFSLVTFPFAVYSAGTSLAAGELLKAGLYSGYAFIDFTQIREHGKPPNEQSWYNPERLIDRLTNLVGRNRFRQPASQRMLAATS